MKSPFICPEEVYLAAFTPYLLLSWGGLYFSCLWSEATKSILCEADPYHYVLQDGSLLCSARRILCATFITLLYPFALEMLSLGIRYLPYEVHSLPYEVCCPVIFLLWPNMCSRMIIEVSHSRRLALVCLSSYDPPWHTRLLCFALACVSLYSTLLPLGIRGGFKSVRLLKRDSTPR